MSNKKRFLAYLDHCARKNLEQISSMFADDVTLRDWNISVSGKQTAVRETARNFESATAIDIQTLSLHESDGSVAGELRRVVDGKITLVVVDVIAFDTNRKIKSMRAYLGRGGN